MSTLLTPGDERLREVLRQIFAFYEHKYRLRSGSVGLTKVLIEKAVWEFKVSLPPDHELAESIGFYWWRFGFYSDVLYSTMDSMIADGQIEVNDKEGWESLSMSSEWIKEPLSDDRDLKDRIEAFLPSLAKFDVFMPVEEIMLVHYNSYAPTQFCLTFPRRFVPTVETFLEAAENGRPLKLGPLDLTALSLSRLEDSVVAMPLSSYFDSFRRNFLELATTVERFLRHHEELGVASSGMGKSLDELLREHWILFCMFLREKFHDSTLSYRVSSWRADREQMLTELASKTDALYDQVLVAVGEDRLGEKLVDRGELVQMVREGVANDEIEFIDANDFALDWTDLHRTQWEALQARLEHDQVRKARLRYRKGKQPEELALKVRA